MLQRSKAGEDPDPISRLGEKDVCAGTAASWPGCVVDAQQSTRRTVKRTDQQFVRRYEQGGPFTTKQRNYASAFNPDKNWLSSVLWLLGYCK